MGRPQHRVRKTSGLNWSPEWIGASGFGLVDFGLRRRGRRDEEHARQSVKSELRGSDLLLDVMIVRKVQRVNDVGP